MLLLSLRCPEDGITLVGHVAISIRRYETQINANNQIFIQVGTRHFGLVDRAVLTAPGVTVPCFLLHFDVHDSTVRY